MMTAHLLYLVASKREGQTKKLVHQVSRNYSYPVLTRQMPVVPQKTAQRAAGFATEVQTHRRLSRITHSSILTARFFLT